MIPKELLASEVQSFIKSYHGNIPTLALKRNPFPNVPFPLLLQQIEGFRKAEKKLPTWAKLDGIIYPPKLNLEQTSSETTAKYKASLLKGNSLADLTGGFGIDTYYYSQHIRKVSHFEHDPELSGIAQHNFKRLGAQNIQCFIGDSLALIKDHHYDTIFIDPSRRHESKGKVFFLEDCEPNVVEHLDFLRSKAQTILIKTAPMLDISVGVSALRNITEIHIVAVNNEVKELLWKIEQYPSENIRIKTINFRKETTQTFDFDYYNSIPATYSNPKDYLYEPNAALLKAGAFSELSGSFSLAKLAPHSHLYTANMPVDFPGRKFKVVAVIPYTKKDMKDILGKPAHVTTRNFAESVAQIRKKWKIPDGGIDYLFFTTLESGEKVVIKTLKITKYLP